MSKELIMYGTNISKLFDELVEAFKEKDEERFAETYRKIYDVQFRCENSRERANMPEEIKDIDRTLIKKLAYFFPVISKKDFANSNISFLLAKKYKDVKNIQENIHRSVFEKNNKYMIRQWETLNPCTGCFEKIRNLLWHTILLENLKLERLNIEYEYLVIHNGFKTYEDALKAEFYYHKNIHWLDIMKKFNLAENNVFIIVENYDEGMRKLKLENVEKIEMEYFTITNHFWKKIDQWIYYYKKNYLNKDKLKMIKNDSIDNTIRIFLDEKKDKVYYVEDNLIDYVDLVLTLWDENEEIRKFIYNYFEKDYTNFLLHIEESNYEDYLKNVVLKDYYPTKETLRNFLIEIAEKELFYIIDLNDSIIKPLVDYVYDFWEYTYPDFFEYDLNFSNEEYTILALMHGKEFAEWVEFDCPFPLNEDGKEGKTIVFIE